MGRSGIGNFQWKIPVGRGLEDDFAKLEEEKSLPNCGDDVLSSCHKYTATDRELGKSDKASKSG